MSDSTMADALWHRMPWRTGQVSFHQGIEISPTVAPSLSSSPSAARVASLTSASASAHSRESLITAIRRPATSGPSASPYAAVRIGPRTHCGSFGSSPAIASSVSATSRTVRAIGQT